MHKCQESDKSLYDVREAVGKAGLYKVCFIISKNGLFYCVTESEDEELEQQVLPLQCQQALLSLAHGIPLAGHLWKNKVLQRFYSTPVNQDVAEYCRSYPVCQKKGKVHVVKALLLPLPIIEEPLQRIAMDSSAGNKSHWLFVTIRQDTRRLFR